MNLNLEQLFSNERLAQSVDDQSLFVQGIKQLMNELNEKTKEAADKTQEAADKTKEAAENYTKYLEMR